jgi:hypothetical protein
MTFLRVLAVSLVAATLYLAASFPASASWNTPTSEAGKLLPATVGDFRAVPEDFKPQAGHLVFEPASLDLDEVQRFGGSSAKVAGYRSKTGQVIWVALVLTRSNSSAFSLFTNIGCPGGDGKQYATLTGLEASSCILPARVRFAKGPVYVALGPQEGRVSPETLSNFASQLATTLDKGEGDIPALVKHLPGWESGDLHALYSVSLPILKNNVPNQPIFDSVSFDGGVEAASAHYGASQLVILEFNTPQLATDNDTRIVAKLQELRAQGQPTPTGYRRVGNYAVFVFNAPDEQAANQLIDQVKYQQVVQWLGENPFAYEKATREFTETTLGVLVSVVKTSGLALLACLAVGGFFGALLFRVRRSQQRAREAYADSDAMLRLNLDDLTPESDQRRLLGRGN